MKILFRAYFHQKKFQKKVGRKSIRVGIRIRIRNRIRIRTFLKVGSGSGQKSSGTATLVFSPKYFFSSGMEVDLLYIIVLLHGGRNYEGQFSYECPKRFRKFRGVYHMFFLSSGNVISLCYSYFRGIFTCGYFSCGKVVSHCDSNFRGEKSSADSHFSITNLFTMEKNS
jgi:hypothetical protein